MALRAQFTETVAVPMGPANDLIPVPGIAARAFQANPTTGLDGAPAIAYNARVGTILAASTLTDAAGRVSFYLDPGEYNIHFDDPQSPPRIASFVRSFTSGAGVASGSGGALSNIDLPVGVILPYTGTSDIVDDASVPHWMICNGRGLIRTSFPALDAMLNAAGYPFGSGDGSTTFNIPDTRQRFLMGKAASGAGSTLGGTGGSTSHIHSLDGAVNGALIKTYISTNTFEIHYTTPSNILPGSLARYTNISVGGATVNDAASAGANSGVALSGVTAGGDGTPPFIAINHIIKVM